MDEESKKLLESTFELAKENNEILKTIRRRQKIATIVRALYWILIIGIALGAFYFLQPYVDGIRNIISGSRDTLNQFNFSNN